MTPPGDHSIPTPAITTATPGENTEAGENTQAALARLRHHATHARGAFSPATERALRADIFIFAAWCAEAAETPLPATPETVAGFIDAMAAKKAPATIRRSISSIATFHRAAGLSSPTDSMEVKLALKRMHREKGRAQAQASPLNRQHVEKMLAATSDRPRDVRDRALLAVAYDTLCRRSELVALQVIDLAHGPHGDGTISIRRSKTDQEGAGTVRYLAPDTMRHVTTWLAVAGITDGELFRAVPKGGRIGGALNGAEVSRRFKGMAEHAGLAAVDVRKISGHSSRVGAAQDMVRHGVELPAIMQAGGWQTAEMVARYTARLDARRSGAAKLAIMQNRA